MNDKQAASCNETAVAVVELLFRIHQDGLKKTTIHFAMSCGTRTGFLPDT
jgi:hypothetical protein